MRRFAVIARVAFAACAVWASPAAADEAASATPRRPVPDYDGRGAAPPDAGDQAAWVARVPLLPVYGVFEYGLRRPLKWLVTQIDEHHVTGDGSGGLGVLPSFRIDVGQQSNIGVIVSLDQRPFAANDLLAHVALGGVDWLRATAVDRLRLDARTELAFGADAWRRSDGLFYGLGPRSRVGDRSLYASDSIDASVGLRHHREALDEVRALFRVHAARFTDDPCCGPTLSQREAEGRLSLPPGFGGYTAFATGVGFALDSRAGAFRRTSGVRLSLDGEHAVDLAHALEARWVRYGGRLEGFVDLTGHSRVLALAFDARLADPLGAAPVPFTELPSLGGDGPLPGLPPDRVLDRSIAAATLSYTWPIWIFLEGTAHVAVGNGFGEHLRGLDPRLCRLSFGGGFRMRGEHRANLELLLAAGTEPFDAGTSIEAVRFVLALSPGSRPLR